ncbi:hypothetical protein LQF12_03005 [Ruania suaedae]|uniref:YqeB family protein n=1 Tax=Ruania suaedae TaxID=2897774 RepID=UPI001E49DEBB|nr:hypothetical protein [Ruania suaedae]UFU03594.1 hypothetical protein LQF12_03005 [Ruania suaedae]
MEITHLHQSRAVPLGFGLAVLAPGVGLGFGGPALAAWLVGLIERSPLPVPGLLEVIAGLPWAWSIPIGVLLGVVGGVLLAMTIVHEALSLTVATDHLEYRQEGREGWIERAEVASIHPDGRDVVVLDERGRVRARLNAEALESASLARTLREFDYPWRQEDPFEGDYQRWMDGRPGFSAAEHALIGRWQEARRKPRERTEAEAALREADLAVRYRDGRVQVRRVGGAGRGADSRPAAS